MEFLKTAYLCIILGICVITDFREKKIKNCFVLAIFVATIAFLMLKWNGQAVAEALWILILFFVVLFPFFVIGAVGAGDVKLFCAAAFYVGREGIPFFLGGALACAGIVSFSKLMFHGIFLKRVRYFLAYVKNALATGDISVYGISHNEKEILRLAVPAFAGGICWAVNRFYYGV